MWLSLKIRIVFAKKKQRSNKMNNLKSFLLNHPLIGMLLIFPFVLVLTALFFSFILEIALPFLVAIFFTRLIYFTLAQHNKPGPDRDFVWSFFD